MAVWLPFEVTSRVTAGVLRVVRAELACVVLTVVVRACVVLTVVVRACVVPAVVVHAELLCVVPTVAGEVDTIHCGAITMVHFLISSTERHAKLTFPVKSTSVKTGHSDCINEMFVKKLFCILIMFDTDFTSTGKAGTVLSLLSLHSIIPVFVKQRHGVAGHWPAH